MAKENILEGKLILAVDDEMDILSTIEELLEGCTIHKATNHYSAQQYLQSYNYSIVILDIMGVDGFTLLRIAVAKKFPTVIITAHALSPESLEKAIKLGAVSFLPKEALAELKSHLEDVISREGRSAWKEVLEKLQGLFSRRFGADWKEKNEFFKEFEEELKKSTDSEPATRSYAKRNKNLKK